MARGDSGKWVARAGATGGGRSYRGQRPMKWYSSLAMICLLGVALIVYSRYERQHPAPAVPPAVGAHWYQALGFDVCGKVQPNLPANPNASASPIPGIRTDGDGVIQVAPTTNKDAGNNATFARFVANYPKLKLTSSTLQIPGTPKYSNGDKCPAGSPDAGKAGQLQIKVWPSFTPPGSNNPQVFHDPERHQARRRATHHRRLRAVGRVGRQAALDRGHEHRPGRLGHLQPVDLRTVDGDHRARGVHHRDHLAHGHDRHHQAGLDGDHRLDPAVAHAHYGDDQAVDHGHDETVTSATITK